MKKIYRLKKSYEIAKVIHQKQSVGNRYYAIFFKTNDMNIPKVAISVSKRHGGAVLRNYAKRVVREIIRPMLPKLTNVSLVIIIKDESKKLGYNDKRKTLEKLINRILNILKSKHNEEIK